jgi:hypothetical protein
MIRNTEYESGVGYSHVFVESNYLKKLFLITLFH